MSTAVITGVGGLVGSAAARHFAALGLDIIGIDNDMRASFFGEAASTRPALRALLEELGARCQHHHVDVRDRAAIEELFRARGRDIALVIHAAGQPSHDWAARDPHTDFSINATGTLVMLEATRQFAPDAVFLFTSTNKVYGDSPNRLPLVEMESRWEIEPGHRFAEGIDETMTIDASLHSVFGASKVAADVMVQEYGRYFGLRSAVFRCGCLTGPVHAAAPLHGFLAWLARCAVEGTPYTVFGYQGKQVRDNLHADDLALAFEHAFRAPRLGEVYNLGGSRFSHCSMREAIALCEQLTGRAMRWSYDASARVGDHQWYVTDIRKFQAHYPGFRPQRDLETTLREIIAALRERGQPA